ncbi:MAG: TonB-dependent receptor plug domain-containing protein [Nitrospirae bacterium]|nr:TonB-dependent receptor plug domain-containing protein [Nitrospirota bacterium]
MYYYRSVILLFSILSLLSLPDSSPAVSDEEKTFLSMYFEDDELVVLSATRSLMNISRVAENVVVVTRKDIELMNAHTVADVLNTVNGVQIRSNGGSGSIALLTIQGSDPRHAAVFIDGVQINNLGDNIADIAALPVEVVERVEVIKGPASSQWGSSLGGVINVITKAPKNRGTVGGMVSVSYGESEFGDLRAEASGRTDRSGYYLFAGRLQTDGLTRGFDLSEDHLYARFFHDLSRDTGVYLSVLYGRGDRGRGDDVSSGRYSSNKFENILSSVSVNTSPGKGLALSFSLRASSRLSNFYSNNITTGREFFANTNRDSGIGGSAKLTLTRDIHNIVAGLDYDHETLSANYISGGKPEQHRSALFFNDTIAIGRLSIIPGLRYDRAKSGETTNDFLSPSFGITYNFEKTIFRAYFAKGFNIPALGIVSGDSETFRYRANPELSVEKINSWQIGVETGDLGIIWLKIAGFRHDISDVITPDAIDDPVYSITYANKGKQRRQGLETEFRTVTFWSMTLFGGATLMETRDLIEHKEVKGVPEYTCDIGIRYDSSLFRALLKGRYIKWNTDTGAEDDDFVFDLSVHKEIYQNADRSAEAFFSVHNLFNGSQHFNPQFGNPARWIEAGMRFKF